MAEYNPEYKAESVVLSPTTHRGGGGIEDDDKGPIHTIPAPNLSLADKPYTNSRERIADRHPYMSSLNYRTTAQSKPIS